MCNPNPFIFFDLIGPVGSTGRGVTLPLYRCPDSSYFWITSVYLLNLKNDAAGSFLSRLPLNWAWPESLAAESSELRVGNSLFSINLCCICFSSSWTQSSLNLGTSIAESMWSLSSRRLQDTIYEGSACNDTLCCSGLFALIQQVIHMTL